MCAIRAGGATAWLPLPPPGTNPRVTIDNALPVRSPTNGATEFVAYRGCRGECGARVRLSFLDAPGLVGGQVPVAQCAAPRADCLGLEQFQSPRALREPSFI